MKYDASTFFLVQEFGTNFFFLIWSLFPDLLRNIRINQNQIQTIYESIKIFRNHLQTVIKLNVCKVCAKTRYKHAYLLKSEIPLLYVCLESSLPCLVLLNKANNLDAFASAFEHESFLFCSCACLVILSIVVISWFLSTIHTVRYPVDTFSLSFS